MKSFKNENGTYDHHAFPGGYPIYYICQDNGILCPKCANDNAALDTPDDPQWHIVGADINYTDPDLFCDNCCTRVESAYED